MSIEVSVDSRASGGLKLIPYIPRDRPCRLEGRNGIGKSALIRLLVLASGHQPYLHEPAAWASLKALVGPTVLTISGMSGEHTTAKLTLTPDEWPDIPDREIGPWLGHLSIDGATAQIEELFDCFSVVHLVGTERLSDTLRQQYARFSTALNETSRQLSSIDDQRAELGEIDDQLRFVSPQAVATDSVARLAAEKERRDLEPKLKSARDRVNDLQLAAGIQAMLDATSESGKADEIQQLRQKLTAARAELPQREQALENALRRLSRGTAAQQAAEKAERRLSEAIDAVDRSNTRQLEIGRHLAELGIDPQSPTLTSEEAELLRQAIEAAEADFVKLRKAALRQRRSQAENEVLDELRVVLSSAEERGLADLVLFDLDGTGISVSMVRNALGGHASEPIEDDPELSKIEARLSELRELARLFADRPELAKKLDGAIKQAEKDTGSDGHDDLQEAVATARIQRDKTNSAIRSLNSRIGALSPAGFPDIAIEDAKRQVDELLQKYNVEWPNLGNELTNSINTLTSFQDEDRNLRSVISSYDDTAAERRVARENLWHKIHTKQSHSWLKGLAEQVPHAQESPKPSSAWPDDTWEFLSERVSAARQALGSLVGQIEGLTTVAMDTGSTGALAEALDALVEQDLRDELAARPIAEALFDGGNVNTVDLTEQTVTWTTPHGETRTRPLTAFSSGEQALGFIRARLQQVADSPADNRLVFLDEFGAFISADRRKPLAELLISDSVAALTNEVIVVLPLQADYEAELEQTTGELHDDYARRVAAVNARGYFTEVLKS